MDKTTVLPVPLSGIDTYFIASDWHSYFLNPACISILLQHAAIHKPEDRRLIINGDFLDLEFLMKKKESYRKNISRVEGIEDYFIPMYEEEMKWGNDCLDVLQSVFSEIIFLSGNHDKPRVDGLVQDCPDAYKHNFNYKESLYLDKRKIIFIEYNNWVDIGDISITHGMFHGPSALKKHYLASGARSCIFGHVHHDNKESFMVRGKTRQAHSLPAMCDLNPDYIRNSETNWTNGYGIISMKPSGHFNYHCFTIWDNELVLPSGKVIKLVEDDNVKKLCKDYYNS